MPDEEIIAVEPVIVEEKTDEVTTVDVVQADRLGEISGKLDGVSAGMDFLAQKLGEFVGAMNDKLDQTKAASEVAAVASTVAAEEASATTAAVAEVAEVPGPESDTPSPPPVRDEKGGDDKGDPPNGGEDTAPTEEETKKERAYGSRGYFNRK